MKIISGSLKGRNFFMPKGIRPTQDLVRKAVFDYLGQDMTGLTFLDLFAGSGAMGFEALSRGAEEVTFVEKDYTSVRAIQDSLTLLKSKAPKDLQEIPCEVLGLDSLMAVKRFAQIKRTFDIVFADPPYGRELAKKTLKTLEAHDILHADSFVIIQHDKHESLPESQGRLLIIGQRNYGSTVLTIYQESP